MIIFDLWFFASWTGWHRLVHPDKIGDGAKEPTVKRSTTKKLRTAALPAAPSNASAPNLSADELRQVSCCNVRYG